MDEITVLVVDDHTIMRQGLKRILEESNIKVIGEAADGSEAVEKVDQLQPDVVLMDIEMPRMSGIEATRIIRRENPQIYVVVLTIHEEEAMLFEAIKAGAIGYVSKDKAPQELLEVIRSASQGLSLLRPSMASKILNEFSQLQKKKTEQEQLYSTLSNREKEILSLIVKGMSNKEIAKTLFISDKTVKNHLRNIFSKLHINDRTTAAVIAVRQGLIE